MNWNFDNHISEIDLSSNSNLEYLYAFGNNLSDVDLSNNNSSFSLFKQIWMES